MVAGDIGVQGLRGVVTALTGDVAASVRVSDEGEFNDERTEVFILEETGSLYRESPTGRASM